MVASTSNSSSNARTSWFFEPVILRIATLQELWFYERLRFNKLNTVGVDGATSMVMLRFITSISTIACVR